MSFLSKIKSVVALILSLYIACYLSFYLIAGTGEQELFVQSLLPGVIDTDLKEAGKEIAKERTDSELEEDIQKKVASIARSYEQTGEESPAENFIYEEDANGIKITEYLGLEEKVVIPAVIDKKPVVTIGMGCFQDNIYLTEVVIPDTVMYIETAAFAHCSGLTTVEIPVYCVTIGWNCFENDAGLRTVTKRVDEDGVYHSVKNIGDSAFKNCSSLSEVYLPGEGFGEVTIEDYVFQNCTSLTAVTLPDNVKYIGEGAFTDCAVLSKIVGLESAIEIRDACFEKCSSLTEIRFSGDITYIGSYAFKNCTSLAGINFGERTVTTTENGDFIATYIGYNCFEGTAIREVNLPGYVETIADDCFLNCTELTSFVWQPSGRNQATQQYGMTIFEGCSSLTDVYLPITIKNAWEFTWNGGNFTVHTNSQSVREYCEENQIPYDDWN